MAVSAAELPAMSSALGDASQVAAYLQRRLNGGLRQIAFFVVPSAMAFLALGDVIAALLLADWPFRARRFYLCLEHRGGIVGGTAGVDVRPPVFVDLLRAARHAHAAAIRDDPRSAHDGSWVSVRAAVAAMDWDRSALGRRRSDSVGGSCRVGGVHATA